MRSKPGSPVGHKLSLFDRITVWVIDLAKLQVIARTHACHQTVAAEFQGKCQSCETVCTRELPVLFTKDLSITLWTCIGTLTSTSDPVRNIVHVVSCW